MGEDTGTIDFNQDTASILRELDNDIYEEDEEPDVDNTATLAVPTLTEALTALSTLKDFFASTGMVNELAAANKMDKTMFNTSQNLRVQSSLETFGFSKKL